MNPVFKNIKHGLINRNALQRLIIFNVAVFVVVGIIHQFGNLVLSEFEIYFYTHRYVAVPSSLIKLLYHPWTLFTYAFYHEGFMHILFNMLWLYWMGRIFTEYLGSSKLIAVYFLGAVSGALMFVLCYNIFPLFKDTVELSFALGASASVLAITLAAATLLPDYEVHLLFFGPVKLKWIAAVTIVLDLLNISGSNAGGHIAHLGGALFGYIYIKQLKKGNDTGRWVEKIAGSIQNLFSSKPKLKVAYRKRGNTDEAYAQRKKSNQEIIDHILDKISKSGYGSLTTEEKDLLFKASKNTTEGK